MQGSSDTQNPPKDDGPPSKRRRGESCKASTSDMKPRCVIHIQGIKCGQLVIHEHERLQQNTGQNKRSTIPKTLPTSRFYTYNATGV